MATVLCSVSIPVTFERDISANYRFYKLQSSTATAPSKPTSITTLPPSGWDDTEPQYSSATTSTLYTVDLTVYSDGTFSYTDVSKSTSYEASKDAYNLAYNTNEKVDNLEVGGRNLVWDTGFNNVSSRWTAWGSPTTREIVTVNSKRYMHLITTANTSFQGYQQNSSKRAGYGEVKGGDTVTISFLAYSSVADRTCAIGFHWLNSSGSIVNQTWYSKGLTTTPTRYVFGPATVPVNTVGFNVMLGVNNNDIATSKELWMGELKVELGNLATAWSPAPEDVDNDISEAKKMATNLFSSDDSGVMIYDATSIADTIDPMEVTSSHTFRNVFIDSDSVDIRAGLSVLASFGETTTIGRDDVVKGSYITLTSDTANSTAEMNLYSKTSSGHVSKFRVSLNTNARDYVGGMRVYSSDSDWIFSYDDLKVSEGFTTAILTCLHPNSSSGFEVRQDLASITETSVTGTFSPDTGASYTVRYKYDSSTSKWGISVKITKGTDSSITAYSSRFAFGLTITGGITTSMFLGGTNKYANFAVLEDGKIYSRGMQLNDFMYQYGDTFEYTEDYWVTSGYITGSKKSIWFSITLPKALPNNGSNVSIIVNDMGLAIRTQNTSGAGAYLAPTSSDATSDGCDYTVEDTVTITPYVSTPNTVTFYLANSNAYVVSTGTLGNNVPLAIRIWSLSLTFNEAS